MPQLSQCELCAIFVNSKAVVGSGVAAFRFATPTAAIVQFALLLRYNAGPYFTPPLTKLAQLGS